MYEIFVINLESSVERRHNISRQLDELGLPFSVFSAVNGREGHHPLFDNYDDHLSQLYRGKSLSKGQLGCYASHYLLWQKCVELNKPIIVIEDDALLYPAPMTDFARAIPTLDPKFECIRLFDNKRKAFNFTPLVSLGATSVCKFTKGHMSATGYYLTPTGARKFLAHSDRWYMAVDIYMDRFWINQVDCYGTAPACLTNDPIFDSDIGYDSQKPPRSLLTRCKREWFNLTELFKRETHNALYKIKQK